MHVKQIWVLLYTWHIFFLRKIYTWHVCAGGWYLCILFFSCVYWLSCFIRLAKCKLCENVLSRIVSQFGWNLPIWSLNLDGEVSMWDFGVDVAGLIVF